MRFQYLGTAAAEGWPALFCICDNCKRAREAGGRNIRTRSQAVVDDKLLIDFPADTYMHMLYLGLDLTKVENCIITHNHGDHFYPVDFGMRSEYFTFVEPESHFTVYGTAPSGKKVAEIIDKYDLKRQERLEFKNIIPFVPFTADGYEITPLKADHDPKTEPVIYIISDNKKSILYANDTGYFPDETWNYLKEHKHKLDFVSLDCTIGTREARRNHMSLETATEVKERLIEMACADSDTRFCLQHFSHNGTAIYDELVPVAEKFGFLVAYDGMKLEI